MSIGDQTAGGNRYLLIISCSDTKSHESDLLPAWRRYRGRVFTAIDKLLPSVTTQRNLDVVIISAKYGFLRPDSLVEDYDLKMTFALAEVHRLEVTSKILALCAIGAYRSSFVLLEPEYLETIDLDRLPSAVIEREISQESINCLMEWILETRSGDADRH
jgi:hypothetical protein